MMEPGTVLVSVLEAIKYAPSLMRLASFFQSMVKDEAPDNANTQKQLLEFHAWLLALTIGMRQLVALSGDIDHDVQGRLLDVHRVLGEKSDQVAEHVMELYPEYDLEMAKTLIKQIVENLESFLPPRLSGAGDGEIGGSAP